MQSVLLFNFGNATLAVAEIQVAGKGFAMSGKTESLAVQPGHTADLELTFKPTADGAEAGTLRFVTNDPLHPTVTVSLSATGGAAPTPGVLVTPASVAFGNVPIGGKDTAAISIENTGTAGLAVSSITTTGKGYTVVGASTSADIAPGSSISVQVILAPTLIGASSGSVQITTNASSAPIVIPLTGAGVAAIPELSLSASSVSFGSVLLGGIGSRTVTFSNIGTANLVISQLNVTGTVFTASGLTVPSTIAPGQSSTVKINFVPILSVLSNGSLVIQSNSTATATGTGSSSATVSLSGTGISTLTNAVKLSWSSSVSPNIVGYNIYRSTVSGGPYTLVSGPITGTKFSDANVVAGQTYYYVLTSVDANGIESGYSGQAAVTVPGS